MSFPVLAASLLIREKKRLPHCYMGLSVNVSVHTVDILSDPRDVYQSIRSVSEVSILLQGPNRFVTPRLKGDYNIAALARQGAMECFRQTRQRRLCSTCINDTN